MDISSILGYLLLAAFILGFIYLVYWSFTDEKESLIKSQKTFEIENNKPKISNQEIPDWFEGEIYENGKYVLNSKTNEQVYLNNLEASIYDVAYGSVFNIELLKLDSALTNLFIEDYKKIDPMVTKVELLNMFENHFSLTSNWLLENNYKIYMLLKQNL